MANRFVIPILFLTLSCIYSCDKDDNCVDDLLTDFSDASDEFQADLIREVFENDNFIVSTPIYFSPNGDGLNDRLSFRVERKDSDILFVSANGPINNPELTSDPEGYLLGGSIVVSNNCETVFESQQVDGLSWAPSPSSGDLPSSGNYNLNLIITLADGEMVELSNSLDISRWGTNE